MRCFFCMKSHGNMVVAFVSGTLVPSGPYIHTGMYYPVCAEHLVEIHPGREECEEVFYIDQVVESKWSKLMNFTRRYFSTHPMDVPYINSDIGWIMEQGTEVELADLLGAIYDEMLCRSNIHGQVDAIKRRVEDE